MGLCVPRLKMKREREKEKIRQRSQRARERRQLRKMSAPITQKLGGKGGENSKKLEPNGLLFVRLCACTDSTQTRGKVRHNKPLFSEECARTV